MAVLPGVLGCSFGYAQDKLTLRRAVQVRLGTNTLRLPGGTPILFALAAFPPPLKLRRDKPLSPASGFPVSWSRDSNS
jgi:hypothetical protein